MKRYNTAPLPFQGQKRNFIKKFRQVIKDLPDDTVFVDLFGGSGLLSHNAKYVKPKSRVVYNDYDNYKQRLENIDATNAILDDLRNLTADVDYQKKISEDLKAKIIKRIMNETAFVDYITLSSSLLFSGNFAENLEELEKGTFYAKVVKTKYSASGYLEGVERVSLDYLELLEKHKDNESVVLILDPPYLSTDVKTYTNEKYWKLADYLDVLSVTQGNSYIYFTSNKGGLIELSDWFSKNGYWNPFADAIFHDAKGSVNYSAKYEDKMICKI